MIISRRIIFKSKLYLLNVNKLNNKVNFDFSTINSTNSHESEKTLMKKLYSNKIDDSFIGDSLKELIKSKPAFIVYKGEIKMDNFAKTLHDYNINATIINLNINPVLNEAFAHFYPFINKNKYLLFLNGKLADTDDFLSYINKGEVEEYLKNYKLV